MPYLYNGKIIREGRSWTDDAGIKHPTNWASWSDTEKAAKGLVWQDPPAAYDNRFWWDAATPKALDDIPAVNENGDPVLDESGEQVITPGLRSVYKAQVKQQAGQLLAATDWYVVRNAETGQVIPASVLTQRSAVRAYSDYLEGEIDAAADHAAFVALFEAPEGSVAPMFDWPEE
jgi:hypothetical protein